MYKVWSEEGGGEDREGDDIKRLDMCRVAWCGNVERKLTIASATCGIIPK
jgi:hypothetical protein